MGGALCVIMVLYIMYVKGCGGQVGRGEGMRLRKDGKFAGEVKIFVLLFVALLTLL